MDTTATSKAKVIKSAPEIRPQAWVIRGVLRMLAILFNTLLTRTTIEGRENIPDGPAIFTANHASIYDAILYYVILPFSTQYVGPGDFRLAYPNRIASEWTDVILVKRGSSDKTSLRRMLETLKGGRSLALFPEGGTWEKDLYDVKDGAAYLSMATQTPIVPIAISGAYDLWSDIFALRRPHITVRILPPMPAIEKARGQERKKILHDSSIDLMRRIYAGLTDEEINRYVTWMRERFNGSLQLQDGSAAYADASNYSVLSRLVSKKNLFSTFHQHLDLPVQPLQQLKRYHTAQEFRTAVQSVHHALTQALPGYIEYRLGEAANQQIIAELEEIDQRLKELEPLTKMRFVVEEYMVDASELEVTVDNPPVYTSA